MTASLPETWQGFPVYGGSRPPKLPVGPGEGGIVLVDKPVGLSSFAMVRRLRRYLDFRKIGHAGTLDPAAEGLLVMCYGKATKVVESIQAESKTYIGEVCLGKATASYDRETDVTEEAPYAHVTRQMVEHALRTRFTGAVEQTPPAYSALKVDGQPLYKKARRGEEVVVKPRVVTIYRSELTRFEPPFVSLEIDCGKGTYIRSIAHDLGKALDTCAYLAALRRTRIGPFHVGDAFTLPQLEQP